MGPYKLENFKIFSFVNITYFQIEFLKSCCHQLRFHLKKSSFPIFVQNSTTN